ncbi:MAG: ABC transporter ATP-binding protein [Clostridium chrysemydis]|uniref:ABC transporter ATP-binding protein n=1 Tax=Clostridium chrysemydis TaxID=2665504 RepID=UPI003F3BB8ED
MIIELVNYSKKIKNDCVLNNINMKLESGKVYGLCGGNGSGKTMILRAISGLIRPDNGEVQFDGKILELGEFPKSIGLMIGFTKLIPEYTAMQNLKILNSIDNKCSTEELEDTLRRVKLDPNNKKNIKKYSMGMNQKLVIAQAIMGSPDLILLDEPTNSLDDEAIESVREIVLEEKKKGNIIIIASHNKEDIDLLCDEVFTIKLGKIVSYEKK